MCLTARSVTSYDYTRKIQFSSKRKKICEHKDSQAHKEAITIFEMAKKNVLLSLNTQSEQTARVFDKLIL